MPSNEPSGYQGTQRESSGTAEYNALSYLVEQILAGKNHATLVQVKAVTNAGDVSPVGFVDLQPLVNQLTGEGTPVAHGVVHEIPYLRMQGGTNAIILDPQVGDIGIAIFADRDLSSVKSTKAAANPGSMRRSDMADGLYIGGVLNGAPTQYVQFSDAGIKMFSPTAITLETTGPIQLTAPTIEADASQSIEFNTPIFRLNGNMEASGNVTAADGIFGGKAFSTHTHKNVASGSSNSGPPA